MANQITVDILADTKNLVAGVNATKSQLSSLNGSIAKVSGAFKGLAATFGFTVGIGFLKDAVKGAADEAAAFKRITEEFGTDAAAVTAKIGNLSKLFYVDDGEIAKLVLKLKQSLRAELDGLAPGLAEAAIVLSKITGKPLEEVGSQFAKFVRDGKLTLKEVQTLGINLSLEQQKAFDAAAKSGKSVEFILDLLTSDEYVNKAKKLITPFEKWNFAIGELKDRIGSALLPFLEKLINIYDSLSPSQKKVVDTTAAITVGLAALAAVLSPLLLSLGAMVTYGPALKAFFLVVATGIKSVTIALLTNPFAPLVVAIALVIAAVVLLIKNWDSVSAAIKRLASAVAEGVGQFKNTLVNGFNSAKDYLANLAGSFTSLGKNIIQGLVNGIRSMASAPIDAIKGIGSGLVNSFKSFFRIGSPSKLFADYGKNLVQGLSGGIDGAKRLAISSIGSLSADVASPSFSFAGSGSSKAPITVNINAGVGTDPYELGRVVKAALDKYNGVNGRR